MLSGQSPRSSNVRTKLSVCYRSVQREVITAALEGHDVFLQAATGFGKSLCFQLPAVVDYGSQYASFNILQSR